MLITSMDSCCQKENHIQACYCSSWVQMSPSASPNSPFQPHLLSLPPTPQSNWTGLCCQRKSCSFKLGPPSNSHRLSSFIYWMPHLFRLNISISSCVRHFLGAVWCFLFCVPIVTCAEIILQFITFNYKNLFSVYNLMLYYELTQGQECCGRMNNAHSQQRCPRTFEYVTLHGKKELIEGRFLVLDQLTLALENYTEWSMWLQCNHKGSTKWKNERKRKAQSDAMWEGFDLELWALRMEERIWEASRYWKRQEVKFSRMYRKEYNSTSTLILVTEICIGLLIIWN